MKYGLFILHPQRGPLADGAALSVALDTHRDRPRASRGCGVVCDPARVYHLGMANDEPLEWSQALSAVTDGQLKELRRFESQVARLNSLSFFDTLEHTLHLGQEEVDGPLQMEHSHPGGEEALLAALPVFRQIYNTSDERGSATRAISILKRSAKARGTPDGRKLIDLLKGHTTAIEGLEKENGGLQIMLNGEPLFFGRIIDLWLNGDYMHHDEDKAAILEKAPRDILAFQLHGAIVSFRQCYCVLANVVRRCLEEPALSASTVA